MCVFLFKCEVTCAMVMVDGREKQTVFRGVHVCVGGGCEWCVVCVCVWCGHHTVIY